MALGFIELDRRFAEYQPDGSPEEVAQRSYIMGFLGQEYGINWPELLKQRLVVVLGEPGSGKTEELKSQNRLQSTSSFFLELNRLVTEDVSRNLDDEENLRFTTWKKGGDEATFFLDAVDESKIKRNDDFFTALERVKNAIGSAMPRARFVISSRIREWRPEIDLAGVLQRLGIDPVIKKPEIDESIVSPRSRNRSLAEQEETSEAREILVVTLLPLTPSQVERYSTAKGVSNLQSFIKELEDNNAWVFAGRPLDIDLLHAYWNEKGQLSNLTDLSEYMIAQLLEEVPNRSNQDILTPDKAREGVEYLAAATVFCRRLKFSILDAGDVAGENMLSPVEVLPETWLPKERQALLDRAIFDAASHGAMSFHHRYHSDYLTATWIVRLMQGTGTIRALEDLLFAMVNGQRVMRPSLKQVAAWLITESNAPWQLTLAEWILESCPEIHLSHGDPAALSLEYRCRVLSELVNRYKGRKHVRLNLDHAALARFANVGLAEEINCYLKDRSISEDLRADLLMVVRAGKISACLPTTLAIFSDTSTSDNLRSYAVTVIRDAGTNSIRKQLALLWQDLPEISNLLLARLCEALFPHAIGAEGLLQLMRRSEKVPRYSVDLPYHLGMLLKESLDTDQAQVLLKGILELLSIPPLRDRGALSKRFYWTTSLIPLCLQRILAAQNVCIDIQETVIAAIFVLERERLHGAEYRAVTAEDEPPLQQLLSTHNELRRRLFWERVAKYRNKHDNEPQRYVLSGYGDAVTLISGDVDWLLRDAGSDMPLADRRLALDYASNQLWNSRQSLWISAWRLLSNTRGDWELVSLCFQHIWNRLRAPFMGIWYKHFSYKLLEKYWWNSKLHSLRRQYQKIRDSWWLWRHLGELRKGQHPYTLANFARDAGGDSSSQYGSSSWDKISQEWGKGIASAVKQGCEIGWRQFSPLLPHEKPVPNSVDSRLLVGLSGLQTLWREGRLKLAELTAAEVDLLVRYGCNELNGFPEWFPALLETRPKEAVAELKKAIQGEWNYPPDMEHVHDVVAKLAWMPNPTVTPGLIVMERLLVSDPANPSMLRYALAVILRCGEDLSSGLLKVCKTRIASYTTEQPQWLTWMRIWLQLDSLPALNYLESIISTLGEKKGDLVIRLCANMHDRHDEHLQINNPSYLKPSSLIRFIPLVYRHVHVNQDIHRAGQGAYHPGLRDNAQDFRDGLLRSLADSKEIGAEETLRSLLAAPEISRSHDWILHLLDERKYILVDETPWEARDIRAFAKEHRSEPRSDYQLYRLIVRLLRDIKDYVERSENAANRLWVREGDKEENLRGGLLDKLSERSLDWFTVVQEKEVDLRQQPDLSVERSGLNSLPIEVKIAERWTINELLEGLEDQLVGQYLRPENIRHGIYVVGKAAAKHRWKMPDSGQLIHFEQLVSLLQDRAKELQFDKRAEVDGIEVIAIDFSDPRNR